MISMAIPVSCCSLQPVTLQADVTKQQSNGSALLPPFASVKSCVLPPCMADCPALAAFAGSESELSGQVEDSSADDVNVIPAVLSRLATHASFF